MPVVRRNKAAGMIEKLICGDDGLAALGRKLAEVYADAFKKAVNEHPPILKAKQRAWIKEINEMFWEHQVEATIFWGYGAHKMRCVGKP